MAIWESIMFVLLTALLGGGVVMAHRWTKKVTTTYWWWLAISVIYLIIIISVLWSKNASFTYSHLNKLIPANTWDQADQISYTFQTNVCDFVSFAVPFCLIIDPSRRLARSLTPLTFLASFMVLFLGLPFAGADPYAHFTVEYLFLGRLKTIVVGDLQLSFYNLFYFIHVVNLLLAIGIWLTTPRYGWKGLTLVGGSYGIMYAYFGIITSVFDMCGQTSGIKLLDFTRGNYKLVGQVFGNNLIAGQAVFFTLFILVLFLLVVLQDFVFKRGWFKFGNVKSDVWWKYWSYDKFQPASNKKDWGALGRFLAK